MIELLFKFALFLHSKRLSAFALPLFFVCLLDRNNKVAFVLGIANCYIQMGRLKNALWILEKHRGNYKLEFQIAHIHCLSGKYEQSRILYERLLNDSIIRSEPPDYELVANLIEVYRITKRIAEAIGLVAIYVKGKSIDNRPPYLFYNVGCAFNDAKDYEEAIAYYRIAKELGYDDLRSLIHNMGVSYQGAKDNTAALEQFKAALRLSTTKGARGEELHAIGCIYRDSGRTDRAQEYFIESARLNNKKAKEELSS